LAAGSPSARSAPSWAASPARAARRPERARRRAARALRRRAGGEASPLRGFGKPEGRAVPRTRGARNDPRVNGRPVAWRLRGTYLEACNCQPICPCRRIGGRDGGRSTYGVCWGVLSWLIADGYVGEVDLAGLAVVIAMSYSDDEEGSPWT